jgi:hypothetical protein
MHPHFTLDYFPAEYYARPANAQGRLGLFTRLMTRQSSRSALPERVSFADLVSETKSRMRLHLNEDSAIDPEFTKRDSLHGKIQLVASQWSIQFASKPIASLRMVYIQGPKNQIINTWIFPNRPKEMPVFAAELIAVGDEVRVAFVDIQVPVISSKSVLEDTSLMTSGLAARFSALPCDEAPPVWAIESSQGNYTYARNVPLNSFPEVEECYRSYLDTYLDAFMNKSVGATLSAASRDEEAIDELHRYQHHHMESSPGNKFLSKLFGSDWTESFMREFLFAKPRG